MVAPKEVGMALTRKDLAGTAVAALVVATYVANGKGWWFLSSNRWAAVVVFAIGAVGCSVAGRMQEDGAPRTAIAALSTLGGVALGLAIAAIVTGQHGLLLAFVVVLVALWAGATARHALTPTQRAAGAH